MIKSFSEVLLEELRDIDMRRAMVFGATPAGADSAAPEQQALARNLVGMGISGGGIRSATFNLGILQGMADHGLLPYLDYLSTVSGGGYIGSWLHGVISRQYDGCPDRATRGLSPDANPVPKAAADDPVTFLRKYSNYLAPRLSLFSADVWAIGALWIRNMFLNWLVLLPFLAGLLLIPVVNGLTHQLFRAWRPDTPVWISNIASGLLLGAAIWLMGIRLREVAARTFSAADIPDAPVGQADAGRCAGLVFLAAVLIGSNRTDPNDWLWWELAIGAAGLLSLFYLLLWWGGFLKCRISRGKSAVSGILLAIVCPPICAGTVGFLFYWLFGWMNDWSNEAVAWQTLTWGPPMILVALSIGVTLLIGLMGADYPDAAREWIARLGALLFMAAVAWIALHILGVFAPIWIAILFATWWKTAIAAVGSWLATSAAGVLSANSTKSRPGGDSGSSNNGFDLIAKVAPVVFLVGTLALISCGLHWGIRTISGHFTPVPLDAKQQLSLKVDSASSAGFSVDVGQTGDLRVGVPAQGNQKLQFESRSSNVPAWTRSVIPNHWDALRLNDTVTWKVAAGMIALFVISILLATRININEFSMHHFYKNRLVRCYMGASRGRKRRPNSWTGFDPQDDLPLKDLCAGAAYFGPYPIVNTAINLNSGSELATQERRAGSFFYTPLYCGFTPEASKEDDLRVARRQLAKHAYRSTSEFGGKGGPAIGSAMAISGAAANPNMGFHTSGPAAFLLTVFNVRLGWWVGNPRIDKAAKRPGPMFALRYLLAELTAQSDGRSNYLNLSDGGHFDNLGLYELVRRRCRFIIIGDGEQDPSLNCGSLAAAIRKCQTDFGVTIDIDIRGIQETNRLSRAHCVVGTIEYPEQDATGATPWLEDRSGNGRAVGLLLYLKASLTGDEPEDVREFRSRFADFPHQSTADQFFTESQFESYRNLGVHVARKAFHEIPAGTPIQHVFGMLEKNWYPLPIAGDRVVSRLSDAYTGLLDKLRADADLRYLDSEIVPGLPAHPRPQQPEILRRGYLFCLDCVRLAEAVYLNLDFRNPRAREGQTGWIMILQYWSRQPHIREVFENAGLALDGRFRDFFKAL
jgi:hypothetical protein